MKSCESTSHLRLGHCLQLTPSIASKAVLLDQLQAPAPPRAAGQYTHRYSCHAAAAAAASPATTGAASTLELVGGEAAGYVAPWVPVPAVSPVPPVPLVPGVVATLPGLAWAASGAQSPEQKHWKSAAHCAVESAFGLNL